MDPDPRYAGLLTKEQWFAIYKRALVWWPQWIVDSEDLAVWHQTLSDIPGACVWAAMKVWAFEPNDWPPTLPTLLRLAEIQYAPYRAREEELGLRRGKERRPVRDFATFMGATPDERAAALKKWWGNAAV